MRLKIGLAVVLGNPQFRRLTALLLSAMAIAMVISIAAVALNRRKSS